MARHEQKQEIRVYAGGIGVLIWLFNNPGYGFIHGALNNLGWFLIGWAIFQFSYLIIQPLLQIQVGTFREEAEYPRLNSVDTISALLCNYSGC